MPLIQKEMLIRAKTRIGASRIVLAKSGGHVNLPELPLAAVQNSQPKIYPRNSSGQTSVKTIRDFQGYVPAEISCIAELPSKYDKKNAHREILRHVELARIETHTSCSAYRPSHCKSVYVGN